MAESMLVNNLLKSNYGLGDSVPSHIANHNYVHLVKSPSYIQNSGVINNLKDSKMIEQLINSNIKLRSTFESQRSHSK